MSGIVTIMLILFWALFALAVVSFMAYVYIQCMYYKWRKDERAEKQLLASVEKAAKEAVEIAK